jgi:hypothetical protein
VTPPSQGSFGNTGPGERDLTRVRGAPSAWVDTQVLHRDCPCGAVIEVEAASPSCGAGPVRGVDEWQRV